MRSPDHDRSPGGRSVDAITAPPGPPDAAGPPAPALLSTPSWLADLAARVHDLRPADQDRRSMPMPSEPPRKAAVLILLADGSEGPDVLLIERSADLRSHAGQPAFPGGATDPADASPVATALREAREEVGIDARGVRVLATAPELYLPPSRFMVTPVLGWWHTPGPVAPVDLAETSAVARVPVTELADPVNRVLYRHPASGYVSPAFRAAGLFVWGFTAGLLDALLRVAGWERPWTPAPVVDRTT